MQNWRTRRLQNFIFVNFVGRIIIMTQPDAEYQPGATRPAAQSSNPSAPERNARLETKDGAPFEIPQVILDAAAAKREFYYLLSTGEVVEGPQGSWRDRIGPYPTRDAAALALQLAKHRDAAWEEQSKAYRK